MAQTCVPASELLSAYERLALTGDETDLDELYLNRLSWQDFERLIAKLVVAILGASQSDRAG